MSWTLSFLIQLFLITGAFAHELVLDHDFPDPSLIQGHDGYLYAYGTQGTSETGAPKIFNLQLARSRDLKTWEHLGEALPVKPSWAKSTQAFWAPHIHFAHNQYYLFYSADPDSRDGLCLAVATSKLPTGPFVDSGKPLICGPSFSNIDPMAVTVGKRTFLFWGSGFDPIRMRELDETLLKFKDNSVTKNLVSPDRSPDPAPYTRLLEGSWVYEHGGYFYLFVSGENCCSGPDPKYATLVLRSKNFDGPYEWKENDPRKSVVIESAGKFSATGHNSLILHEGKLWTFYHGVNVDHPTLTTSIPGDRTNRRVMLRSEIRFKAGWPYTSSE
jgi:arabinan endo-1,5-alpha-L-arabinosidase